MKSIWYLALTGLLLTGCAQTENLTSTEEAVFTQGANLTLQLQKPVAIGDLTLNLQKVDESRCPINANCVRAGSAITYLQLQDTRGNSTTKVLYLGDPLTVPDNRGFRDADTVNATLGSKTYRLILTEVLPFPNTTDQNPPEKTAKVSVTAL
ncbi:hypothetical protein [Rufibacter hautae]|uniref:Lipoprotein n=1 Tax=Rufibacter hautae TaxID=2595005 RepID=A0A5B6TID5_9BACT|nr:hypothetical protein [Rufibacter hautae]KAA3440181.1 hypothetical protein FOA19_05820 [Rufibacter hautae]